MKTKFRAWDKKEEVMREIKALIWEENNLIAHCPPRGHEYNEWFTVVLQGCEYQLMQSTGLKDKNGVEIYVGDIVILTNKSINYADTYWHNYAEVFQHPNGAYRLRGKGIYETELYSNRKQVTLNGNIYETPELLENDRFCTETDDPDY
ncbi:YopX family protein [Enterococcus nangangensis]|uniref:YopX family protein n=1 Tax=Enterococcus nangangensis TaxID=2559926 RepID=UPI0010F4C33D|nr:YopX family protein [Enterococcus nangangensis]